jgi:hypothetical protein
LSKTYAGDAWRDTLATGRVRRRLAPPPRLRLRPAVDLTAGRVVEAAGVALLTDHRGIVAEAWALAEKDCH